MAILCSKAQSKAVQELCLDTFDKTVMAYTYCQNVPKGTCKRVKQ